MACRKRSTEGALANVDGSGVGGGRLATYEGGGINAIDEEKEGSGVTVCVNHVYVFDDDLIVGQDEVESKVVELAVPDDGIKWSLDGEVGKRRAAFGESGVEYGDFAVLYLHELVDGDEKAALDLGERFFDISFVDLPFGE